MSPLSWIIVALLFCQSTAQEDSYTSANRPDMYKDETGVFKCVFDLTTEQSEDLGWFGLSWKASEAEKYEDYQGCIVLTRNGATSVYAHNDTVVSKKICQAKYDKIVGTPETPTTLEVSVNVDQPGIYACSILKASDATLYPHEPVVSSDQLLVAPTSLKMSFESEVYAGNEVTVVCTSEGGDPEANLVYNINGESGAGIDEPFTASKEDNGKVYSCTDIGHLNLASGTSELAFQEKTLTVYYFMSTALVNPREMSINPLSSETLKCATDGNLPAGNDDVTYKWTQNEDVLQENTMELLISQETLLNATLNETYTCTATPDDTMLKEITQTFIVTWDVKTATPTDPPTTTSEMVTKATTEKSAGKAKKQEADGSATMIIIIVVVVVTAVILVVVIVIICIKKRNSSGANVSKEGSPVQKTGDAEQGNGGDCDATAPMLKKSEGGKEAADESGKQ